MRLCSKLLSAQECRLILRDHRNPRERGDPARVSVRLEREVTAIGNHLVFMKRNFISI